MTYSSSTSTAATPDWWLVMVMTAQACVHWYDTTSSILSSNFLSPDIWWPQRSLLPHRKILRSGPALSSKKFCKHCHPAIPVGYSGGRTRLPRGMDRCPGLWTTTHYHTRSDKTVCPFEPFDINNTTCETCILYATAPSKREVEENYREDGGDGAKLAWVG